MSHGTRLRTRVRSPAPPQSEPKTAGYPRGWRVSAARCRGDPSELEERMTPSLGEILLGRVIDADAIAAENADGGPEPRPHHRAQQARAPVRLERAPEDGRRLVGRELDGLH